MTASLQTGLDQANRQLDHYLAQHQRNQAAAELNACAAKLAEMSRRS